MRRGEVWRYEPVIARAGQSTLRLVVSADSINADDALPTVYVMQVVETDPGSLLAVRIGDLGWAFALLVDRPCANVSPTASARRLLRRWSRSTRAAATLEL